MVVVVVYGNRVVFFFPFFPRCRTLSWAVVYAPNLNNNNIITIKCEVWDEMKPISIAWGPVAMIVVKISPAFVDWAGGRPPRGAQWRPVWRILRHRIHIIVLLSLYYTEFSHTKYCPYRLYCILTFFSTCAWVSKQTFTGY